MKYEGNYMHGKGGVVLGIYPTVGIDEADPFLTNVNVQGIHRPSATSRCEVYDMIGHDECVSTLCPAAVARLTSLFLLSVFDENSPSNLVSFNDGIEVCRLCAGQIQA